MPNRKIYSLLIKRAMDISFAIVGSVLFLPVCAVIPVAIKLDSSGPVFFRQKRPGFQGRTFMLIKFRTMNGKSDDLGIPLPDRERLTRVGVVLRKLSLDELPTLFNVIKGEMSIVGPRPLLAHYLDRYTPEQMRRHEALPGLTGWAQINGRNAITWERKFELDVWYIDHVSFWLDLRIMTLTIWTLLNRKGINQPGQATMEEFRGRAATSRE